jgi:acetyltransferase
VLTNAGGPGVIAADALEIHGLQLAELIPETRAAIAALLPPAAGLHNPIDMLASASPEQFAACLRLLLDDPGVDGAMVILPHPPMYPAESVAGALIPLIHASPKPVVVALMGEQLIQKAAVRFRAARVPEYRFPERAASALAVLAERAEFLDKQTLKVSQTFRVSKTAARAALADAPSGRILGPGPADCLMAAYGIPTAPVKLARTEAEAAKIASELGFPVVLKIASPDIPHKSDVGGVLLNIQTSEEAAMGFRSVTERALCARPDAKIEGVYIQHQSPDGQEVILGASRDAQFGALMMFGSGGVEVEGLKDVAFALAPLTPSEADDMLRRTWAGRKLDGYRNIPPANAESVKEILQRLAQLAHDFPEIVEIEINPLRVLSKGAVAVDVRVKL